ncbi:MCE-family protein MCE1A [Mycolicibacterium chubuense]|uniref:Mce related protein n=1 Tax=Mycolicibacterium chubuense TaxID=1800 RepID=A0A0J6YH90_MYCCU|nr:MCE family protein [Mycolicibacterium chubuense]KMO72271.1 mce related protein [Mycolicibacterium chubuense]ORA52965.1 MCE-family protein MCE1A [Mycolicibacterium chubuense]SPX98039.1 virulence factor Mce family protein [Mycolicibacterium chubuense]
MSVARDAPPYKLLGALLLVVVAVAGTLIFLQFRGDFRRSAELTLVSDRAGLVVEPGAKVTFNGVEVGRVAGIEQTTADGTPQARLTVQVDPSALAVIPANAVAEIRATTVFGNKYVSLSSPEKPAAQHLSANDEIDVASVTTEFNTLFETVTAIAEQVDPVKLNQTLNATAAALDGLGDRFGASLQDGNRILDDLNPRMPLLRSDVGALARLADVYSDASADLWDGLDAAVTTARTLSARSGDIDAALMAALGFADPAADVITRSAPYLVRGAADLLPTSKLLDDYRGMIFCTTRNYAEVGPEIARVLGGDNGYSLRSAGTIMGAGNPFVYPDNLPRVNARGGPEGRPGCWQRITRDLWPAPYLVMDTGFSLAPYNHMELGQPAFVEYVWGRQVGEPTINP